MEKKRGMVSYKRELEDFEKKKRKEICSQENGENNSRTL
jgi:hypothetical protein